MKNCPFCKNGRLAPMGRTHLNMIDGGINELLVGACLSPKCMKISFERPTVTTFEVPKAKEGERLREYLERTL